MKSPHLLLASGNARRLKKELTGVLGPEALEAIEREIRENVRGLLRLGEKHLSFADGLAARDWRQAVSRSYYACYAVSRALRLEVDGYYSTESADHKRVGELPSDFPNRARLKNQLATLREDRNLADYDHTATPGDLVFPVSDAMEIARDLTNHAKQYLVARGVQL